MDLAQWPMHIWPRVAALSEAIGRTLDKEALYVDEGAGYDRSSQGIDFLISFRPLGLFRGKPLFIYHTLSQTLLYPPFN